MGGPFQGDCACRGPSNDRYTRFPFHPLLPVPRAKILKVAEGESLERGAANLFSHSPRIIPLSFFNCMSCRFWHLWSVWEYSSVFEVLYWTFYHPDLKEEKGERLKYPWHRRETPLSFTLSLASKAAGVVTGTKRGSVGREGVRRRNREQGQKIYILLQGKRGGRKMMPGDIRWKCF